MTTTASATRSAPVTAIHRLEAPSGGQVDVTVGQKLLIRWMWRPGSRDEHGGTPGDGRLSPGRLSPDSEPPMTADTERHHRAVAWSGIGRRWAWGLAFGVIAVAAGICALVWPGITLLAAAVIFGVQLIISVWLLLFGVMEISLALRLRSAAQPAHGWYARPRGPT